MQNQISFNDIMDTVKELPANKFAEAYALLRDLLESDEDAFDAAAIRQSQNEEGKPWRELQAEMFGEHR